MWIYRRTEPKLWTVGYESNGEFITDGDFSNRDEARQRVHFLNGGDQGQAVDIRLTKIEEILAYLPLDRFRAFATEGYSAVITRDVVERIGFNDLEVKVDEIEASIDIEKDKIHDEFGRAYDRLRALKHAVDDLETSVKELRSEITSFRTHYNLL